jgi:hypothetical protein
LCSRGTGGGPLRPAISSPILRDDANIDSNLSTAPNGWTARPSSNHPNIVRVCFADGHALALSRDVDIRVYTRALSPDGTLFGQPVDSDVK